MGAHDSTVTASDVGAWIERALIRIEAMAEYIDAINVYPVADGDTGHNVLETVRGAGHALAAIPLAKSLGGAWQRVFEGALEVARGNSGMIVCELLRGLAEASAGVEAWNAQQLAAALRASAQNAQQRVYDARPGTILTVANGAAEGSCGSTIPVVLESALAAGRKSLTETQSMLRPLTAAGVVDAGGVAWLIILEGFYEAASGVALDYEMSWFRSAAPPTISVPLELRYEVELLIEETDDATIGPTLARGLAEFGESLVVVPNVSLWKVHIHTAKPDVVVARALEFGVIRHAQITDMQVQTETRDANLRGQIVFVLVCSVLTHVVGPLGTYDVVAPSDAHDRPGVFWMNPASELRAALAISTVAEFLHLVDAYQLDRPWSENRPMLEHLRDSLMTMVVSDDAYRDPEILSQVREWAKGRVVTVYLDHQVPLEEASLWEDALDAAVVAVSLQAGHRAEIVAE